MALSICICKLCDAAREWLDMHAPLLLHKVIRFLVEEEGMGRIYIGDCLAVS